MVFELKHWGCQSNIVKINLVRKRNNHITVWQAFFIQEMHRYEIQGILKFHVPDIFHRNMPIVQLVSGIMARHKILPQKTYSYF